MWVLAVILLVALLIPIPAILVDAPLGRSVARRVAATGPSGSAELEALAQRLEVRELEVADLTRSVAGMHDEGQFVQLLPEAPQKTKS